MPYDAEGRGYSYIKLADPGYGDGGAEVRFLHPEHGHVIGTYGALDFPDPTQSTSGAGAQHAEWPGNEESDAAKEGPNPMYFFYTDESAQDYIVKYRSVRTQSFTQPHHYYFYDLVVSSDDNPAPPEFIYSAGAGDIPGIPMISNETRPQYDAERRYTNRDYAMARPGDTLSVNPAAYSLHDADGDSASIISKFYWTTSQGDDKVYLTAGGTITGDIDQAATDTITIPADYHDGGYGTSITLEATLEDPNGESPADESVYANVGPRSTSVVYCPDLPSEQEHLKYVPNGLSLIHI